MALPSFGHRAVCERMQTREMRLRRSLKAGESLHRVPAKNIARMGAYLIRNGKGRMIWKGNLEQMGF